MTTKRSNFCALGRNGKIQCWGDNRMGQLGNRTTNGGVVPVDASIDTSAIDVSAGGGFTCANLSNGTIQCWGDNGTGQLGNGSADDMSDAPVTVSGLTNAVAIEAGQVHACALLRTGTVQCWGDNQDGALGNGTLVDSPVPVTVVGITQAIAVATGDSHSCAMLSGGSVQCWSLG